jgi:hypothetical protein
VVSIPTGLVKFLNICKKYGKVQEFGKFEKHHQQWYYVREGYHVDRNTYLNAKEEFLPIQKKMADKWKNYPKIFKLIDILNKLFNANKGAKNVYNKGLQNRCYDRKDDFLNKAISLAKHINLEFFSWGCKLDEDCPHYEVVVYFQIGEEQVSFHTKTIQSAPEFPFDWNGEVNEIFPFSINYVKKLAKKHGLDPTKLKEYESRPFKEPPEYEYWESTEREYSRYSPLDMDPEWDY